MAAYYNNLRMYMYEVYCCMYVNIGYPVRISSYQYEM